MVRYRAGDIGHTLRAPDLTVTAVATVEAKEEERRPDGELSGLRKIR